MGNPVVHVELIGPEPELRRRFYSQMFGWDAPAGAPVAQRISVQTEYLHRAR
jgi:predicted enzyme related to lactoylglutathione lyase